MLLSAPSGANSRNDSGDKHAEIREVRTGLLGKREATTALQVLQWLGRAASFWQCLDELCM